MIDELERLYASLELAADQGDAGALAEAVLRLDAGLRAADARLSRIQADIGLRRAPGAEFPQPGDISQRVLDTLCRCHARVLWGRWRPALRDAYLALGRQSLTAGHEDTARILLEQALAAEPALELEPEAAALTRHCSRLRPGRTFAMPGNETPINLIWHEKSQRYLLAGNNTGQVFCADREFAHSTPINVQAKRPYSFFAGEDALVWLCDAEKHHVLAIGDTLEAQRVIRLADFTNVDLSGFQPFYGATAAGWMYLVIGKAEIGPTTLMRFRPDDHRRHAEVFNGPLFKNILRVSSHKDTVIAINYCPTYCIVMRAEGDALHLVKRVFLPSPEPSEPFTCSMNSTYHQVSTRNSIIRLDQDMFPIYRLDQINTAAVSDAGPWAYFADAPDGETLMMITARGKIMEVKI